MDLQEKGLESRAVFDGTLLHIRQDTVLLPNGATSVREYTRHLGAVCIVPLTDDGCVLMERQYRYAVRQIITEIPAGKLDSAQEDPLAAAKRELQEETGITAAHWHSLGLLYPAVAYSTERIYMYAATGLQFGQSHWDPDEFLEVEKVPLQTLVTKILAGEVPDAKTQAALLRVFLMQQQGLL